MQILRLPIDWGTKNACIDLSDCISIKGFSSTNRDKTTHLVPMALSHHVLASAALPSLIFSYQNVLNRSTPLLRSS